MLYCFTLEVTESEHFYFKTKIKDSLYGVT